VRCADLVMSAMSYHPYHRRGKVARAYWSFVTGWQRDDGSLHTRGGQWHLIELASRFRFRSVREILRKSLPYAARKQRQDGGFQADCAAESACLVLLAYARHGRLGALLNALHYDPAPLAMSLHTPLGIKTRSEALGEARREDRQRARHLSRRLLRRQRRDGSWEGLVVATAQSLHDLLDCGVMPEEPPMRRGCEWLLAQQRPLDPKLFPAAPRVPLNSMFYTERLPEEAQFEAARHPESGWQTKRQVSCVDLLPIYLTGAALAALCRCGLSDRPEVRAGFDSLLAIRGPGGRYYTDHWCACNVRRWLRRGVPKFDAQPMAGSRLY